MPWTVSALHALSTQEQELFNPSNPVDLSHLPPASSYAGLDPSVFLTPSPVAGWQGGSGVLIFLCEHRRAPALQTHCRKIPFSLSVVSLCALGEE